MSPFNTAWSLLKRAEGYDNSPSPSMPDPTMMDDDWDEPVPQEKPTPANPFRPKPWKTPQEADEDEQQRYEDDDWKKVLDEKVRDRAGPATEGPVSPLTMPPPQNSPPPYQTQGMPAPRR